MSGGWFWHSGNEVAAIQEVPAGTGKARLHHARKKLRKGEQHPKTRACGKR